MAVASQTHLCSSARTPFPFFASFAPSREIKQRPCPHPKLESAARQRRQIRLHPPQPRLLRKQPLAAVESQRPVAPTLGQEQDGVDADVERLPFPLRQNSPRKRVTVTLFRAAPAFTPSRLCVLA